MYESNGNMRQEERRSRKEDQLSMAEQNFKTDS